MSVIIKGMKFPKGCDNCDLVQDYDEDSMCCPFLRSESWYGAAPDYRLEHCPLTEVPAPHGRLIDADKLVWFIDNHIASGKKWVEFETIKDMINSLPTILEAEAE